MDGTKLKFFEPAGEAAAHPQQRWSVELVDKYGYEGFDRDTSLRWARQQNVRFITPDEVAVYQVRQNQDSAVAAPDSPAPGDSGFYVQVKIFSVADGHEIKTLRLPTTAQFTKLIPTHDGKFILRIGDVLNLYSANFEQIAWRSLPLEKIEGAEGWQVDVSPSGTQIVLVHQERIGAKSVLIGQPQAANKDHADVEVLDADTLQPIKKFTVKSLRDNWSASDDFLVTAGFDPNPNLFGQLAFNGEWKELKTPWERPDARCPRRMQALPHQRVAVLGCFLGVFSATGEEVFTVNLERMERSVAASGAGSFLATEVDRIPPGRRLSEARPERIEVYDMTTKGKVISVLLTADNPYFDVSAQGSLAVVQNDSLSFYFPKSNQ